MKKEKKKGKKIKLSIIISFYNEEKYLKDCLLSLQKQTFSDFEVILIDDGSTDDSFKKAKELKKSLQFKNLKLFKKKHEGPALARNLGAKKALGEVLVFLDADMYFSPTFLADLVKPVLAGKVKGSFSLNEKVANWDNVWARCWNWNWGLEDKKRVGKENIDQHKDFRAILKKEFLKVEGFSKTGYTDTWSLSEKLDYKPLATNALYYHFNPSSLKEVFSQARWTAKRHYKLGFLGGLVNLFKMSLPFSLVLGLKTAFKKKEVLFLVFKLVFDFASSLGILEMFLLGKKYN